MTDTPFPSSTLREPILRIVPGPTDINANGHIFGGWVLSQMDIAGGIIAGRVAGGAVATVAIEAMKFIAPILMRDIVSVYGHVQRRGTTSIAVHLDVVAERGGSTAPVPLTSGVFTFVAIDEHARPRPLPREAS
ncbi:acyl-CoA thioesterase [soil metagenome]